MDNLNDISELAKLIIKDIEEVKDPSYINEVICGDLEHISYELSRIENELYEAINDNQ